MVIDDSLPEGFYPSIQRAAGQSSKFYQRVHYSLLLINLSLLVVAAILSKFKIQFIDFGYNQTILLALGFVILIYLGVSKPERIWYSKRSLSETIKTLSWRYCCVSAPFGGSEPIDSALFSERIRESCLESHALDRLSSSSSLLVSPTKEMLRVRQLSLEEKVTFYTSCRVRGQLKWYLMKARRNKIIHYCLFVLLCLFSILSVVLSFLKEFQSGVDMPTDVVIALSSSLIAWMQSKKYVELNAAYEMTAYEIESAKNMVHSISNFSEFERYVDEMENLFSREHTQWIAKRSS